MVEDLRGRIKLLPAPNVILLIHSYVLQLGGCYLYIARSQQRVDSELVSSYISLLYQVQIVTTAE